MIEKIQNGLKYIGKGHKTSDRLKIFLSLVNGLIKSHEMPKLISKTTIEGDYKYTCQKGSRDYRKTDVYKDFIDVSPDLEEKTVIDVGAHIGLITIPFAQKYECEVISIEAHPENFELLKQNIALNNLDNVELHNAIASDSEESKELYESREDTGTGTHSIKYDSKTHKSESYSVESKLLDNIYFGKDRKEVGLIKIDVEGAEKEVLEGSKRILEEFMPVIIFESEGGAHLKSIKNLLEPLGYTIRKTNADYIAEPHS